MQMMRALRDIGRERNRKFISYKFNSKFVDFIENGGSCETIVLALMEFRVIQIIYVSWLLMQSRSICEYFIRNSNSMTWTLIIKANEQTESSVELLQWENKLRLIIPSA